MALRQVALQTRGGDDDGNGDDELASEQPRGRAGVGSGATSCERIGAWQRSGCGG